MLAMVCPACCTLLSLWVTLRLLPLRASPPLLLGWWTVPAPLVLLAPLLLGCATLPCLAALLMVVLARCLGIRTSLPAMPAGPSASSLPRFLLPTARLGCALRVRCCVICPRPACSPGCLGALCLVPWPRFPRPCAACMPPSPPSLRWLRWLLPLLVS